MRKNSARTETGTRTDSILSQIKGTPSEADKGLLIAFAMLPLFAIVEAVVRAWL